MSYATYSVTSLNLRCVAYKITLKERERETLFYVFSSIHFLWVSKYPIDILPPLDSMMSHESFSPDGPTMCCFGVTANHTIIPIMRAAELVPVMSKGAYAF